jgi:hypothetical protein
MSTAARRTDDDPHRGSTGGPNALGLSRRHLLLSGTTLAAASALGVGRCGAERSGAGGRQAEYPRHLR